MALYTLEFSQKFPVSPEEIWNFISSPANLKSITPEFMGFEIIGKNLSQNMYPGMIISYHVRPVLGLKTLWVTEITQVKELEYFVDDQRIGPYRLWHHEHYLKQIPGGVLMVDKVSYAPPLGVLGQLAKLLFIEKMLNRIFYYRRTKLEEKFGKFNI